MTEVRNAARSWERGSANEVYGAAWKAALQNLPRHSPKVIAAPQGLRPRRVPSYKFADRARSAMRFHGKAAGIQTARFSRPPTGEAPSGDCSNQALGVAKRRWSFVFRRQREQ